MYFQAVQEEDSSNAYLLVLPLNGRKADEEQRRGKFEIRTF
jgi:hypothetical protein